MGRFVLFLVISFSSLGLVVWLVFPNYVEIVESENALPPRTIESIAEWQIALAREGFSSGSIDGVWGEQTRQALLAYQSRHRLPRSGAFDAATAKRLKIQEPVFETRRLSKGDFDQLGPKPSSWRERGQLDRMRYYSILEMLAEESHSHPDFIIQLNADVEWTKLKPGANIQVPRVPPITIPSLAASIRIRLSSRTLQVYGYNDQLLFHCPVSIAQRVEKRPVGELRVSVTARDPNYTFKPEILTSVAQREGIAKRFVIPPGPNNPVGNAWIGLNLPGYGIHGTPEPEKVGRTESHGCFRVANWDATTLLGVAEINLPVYVEP